MSPKVRGVRIANEIRMHCRKDKKCPPAISIQEPVETGREGGTLTVIDLLPDSFMLDEDYEQKEEALRLRKMVSELSGRERQVILLRYGLGGQPPMTQLETANQLGISRSYISRIEKKALSLLRASLEKRD